MNTTNHWVPKMGLVRALLHRISHKNYFYSTRRKYLCFTQTIKDRGMFSKCTYWDRNSAWKAENNLLPDRDKPSISRTNMRPLNISCMVRNRHLTENTHCCSQYLAVLHYRYKELLNLLVQSHKSRTRPRASLLFS